MSDDTSQALCLCFPTWKAYGNGKDQGVPSKKPAGFTDDFGIVFFWPPNNDAVGDD